MSDTRVNCPNCSSFVEVPESDDSIRCEHCHQQYALVGHMCPSCQTYHVEICVACRRCGEAMSRLCGSCNAPNWPGNERCRTCGASLDILEYIRQHDPRSSPDPIQAAMSDVTLLKALEEGASEKRMSEFAALEAERQAELSRRQLKQAKRERALLLAVSSGVAIILVLSVLYLILT